MTVSEALQRIREIRVTPDSAHAANSAAGLLARATGAPVAASAPGAEPGPGVFVIAAPPAAAGEPAPAGGLPTARVDLRLAADGSGRLASAGGRFLYAAASWLVDVAASRDLGSLATGVSVSPAFAWNRSCYDIFLAQEARIQHRLDPESYVRQLAAWGYTHVEVNALAYPMGLETGPAGEAYPMFYTYCPALDQFVASSLNRGLYPAYYLSANLAVLKRNAELARKYGLVPGLLSFEPRSVPEEFFARYPMLRGPRVDHPFRSFRPRYTMTLAHPRVREHYAEMMAALMREVPDLGFLDVWSNDSGSGFEHTKSLYVGRNGGPYLIREWKDDEEIARQAGACALRFFGVLKDAARAVNPAFRVITRLESFYGEHDTVWAGLGEGLDVETTSLVARGWEMPYRHPSYPDSHAVNSGTVYQLEFADRERELAAELRDRGAEPHFYFSAGPHQMFAPLLGVPYPRLTHRRLALLRENGAGALANVGGTCPPELVPFNVNHEILRRFQFDSDLDIDAAVSGLARAWAGQERGPILQRAWDLAEEAILAFPNPAPLYSTIGFTWYRLWARPLVPDIEAIPAGERAYYERFMCTTPHNPNNVDLSRDVLFTLLTPEQSAIDMARIDVRVRPPLDRAIALLGAAREEARRALGPLNVVEDQWVRLRALRCWMMTLRNVSAWVAGVHGWMRAESTHDKARWRAVLDEMIASEIANSRDLADVVDSGVEFMATTALGESPLVHGRNLKALLARRVVLMERHAGDDPFIDAGFMERMASRECGA
ncbi:MAG TPA: hypothetical protein PLN93_02840 [Vicinamibacterales bacterium]|nr:hypothetical protein [Vicinamibacterales bacterium]HPK70854.1 hypothetical protein [Vicinamibacterales bacterium]